ncbi:MAG TPA: nuclear transport factor 2 family protein [Baekduia sp.]|uniref:nuclear transport factor 2 family protein n=1 Tax=Baekduia sp. TaxID=2600305 RepID=UPI002D781C7F|nr:nuclear transport factor 2 family protein [Baekduia sp.]HET6505226.1 nuclear transport factor 2 family protein [Baekduia sp.]
MSAPQHFRAAVEAQDMDAALATLSPDVVFHSPAVFHEYRGIEAVGGLLRIVAQTFEDFRYTDALSGDGDAPVHALIFRARVGDRELEGMDLVRVGRDGLIDDFTVMIRPASGLMALAQALGPKVEAAGIHHAG